MIYILLSRRLRLLHLPLKITWWLPRSMLICFMKILSSTVHSTLQLCTIVKPVIVSAKRTGKSWQIIVICFKIQFQVLTFWLIRFMSIMGFISASPINITRCSIMIVMRIHCLMTKRILFSHFIKVHTYSLEVSGRFVWYTPFEFFVAKGIFSRDVLMHPILN